MTQKREAAAVLALKYITEYLADGVANNRLNRDTIKRSMEHAGNVAAVDNPDLADEIAELARVSVNAVNSRRAG